ncbi:unnamed protein product, partial [Closterium sp. Naga37s-1]
GSQGSRLAAASAREEEWDLCEDFREDLGADRGDDRTNSRSDRKAERRGDISDDRSGGDQRADLCETLRDDWTTVCEPPNHPDQHLDRSIAVPSEQSGRLPPSLGEDAVRIGPVAESSQQSVRIGPAPSASEVAHAARQLHASIQSLPSHSVSANQLVTDVRRRAVQEGGRDRRVLVVSHALELFSRDSELQ